MTRVAGKTAFTFSNMVLGLGRATFQAVLHDDGDVTLAWLNAAPGAAKNQGVIVGISILTGSRAPASSDLSESLPCSPGHLVPEKDPQPPVVQVFGAWQPFSLVNRTVCYYHGMNDAPGTPPRGCVLPEATPELQIHPAGGLKAFEVLRASGDWLPVKLLRGKKVLSLADGKETNQVYVTGRGEISFSQPEAVQSTTSGPTWATGNSLSQESRNPLPRLPTALHFRQPQISILASDSWERSGGLLVDHKQIADAVVVTLFQGPLPSDGSEPLVLAQATLWWDGMACVTYPSALDKPRGPFLSKEVLVGASPGQQPSKSDFSWHVEALSLPSCTTNQDTVRMPAEVFPAGTMFDLENRLLRFKPMGKSGIGVCVEKNSIDNFPVDPRARSFTSRATTDDLVVEELGLSLERRDFSRGAKFPMLGREYSSAFLAANGYIAFDSNVPDQSVSEAGLHRTRRIAAMFAELNVDSPDAEVFTQQLPGELALWAVAPFSFLSPPLAAAAIVLFLPMLCHCPLFQCHCIFQCPLLPLSSYSFQCCVSVANTAHVFVPLLRNRPDHCDLQRRPSQRRRLFHAELKQLPGHPVHRRPRRHRDPGSRQDRQRPPCHRDQRRRRSTRLEVL